MRKTAIILIMAVALVAGNFQLPVNAQAASLADLAKIQVKVTNENQVRAILGEPKESQNILKQQGGGRAFKDRRDLIYNLDGKDVIIRINPNTGLVVKIIEL